MSKLADNCYKRRYGLAKGKRPDENYKRIINVLKQVDKLILEVNGYLGGTHSIEFISPNLKFVLDNCKNPEVRYFDKHGAFRLLGWLLDKRLNYRKELDFHCQELNSKFQPFNTYLRQGAFDKTCYPGSTLEFKQNPI